MENRDLYQELADYTGRNRDLVEARSKSAMFELAWEWEEYKDDPIKYYRESDLYIFDLTHYQMRLQEAGFHKWLGDKARELGWKNVLDYGGGIGENSIVMMEAGAKVDFVEVKNSKTLKYAKHRFEKKDMSPKIMTEKDHIIKKYDCIIAMDVFEHLEDPKPVIFDFSTKTKHLVVNPQAVRYNWIYPQHISRYELEPFFKNVQYDLWEANIIHAKKDVAHDK